MSESKVVPEACEVPLTELLRSIPIDHRVWIESTWSEDGTCIGHTHIPVGHLMHRAANELELRAAAPAEPVAAQEGAKETAERIVDAYLAKCDTLNPDGSTCEDEDRDLIEPIARELAQRALAVPVAVQDGPTPLTNEFATAMYNQGCAAAAYGTEDISPEEGYGLAIDFAKRLELKLTAELAQLRARVAEQDELIAEHDHEHQALNFVDQLTKENIELKGELKAAGRKLAELRQLYGAAIIRLQELGEKTVPLPVERQQGKAGE